MEGSSTNTASALVHGIGGWFGDFRCPGTSDEPMGNMIRALGGDARATISVAFPEAALHLVAGTSVADLFHDTEILAAIDGYPVWSHPKLSAIAGAEGHGAALAHAYRRYGKDLLPHLHGPFTIAVINRSTRCGLLAIDRLGIYNLCFARRPGTGIVFSTSSKAVASHPAIPATLSPQAIYNYLLLYRVPAPTTIYQDQQKLLPAQYAVVDGNSVQIGFYWHVPYTDSQESNFPALRRSLFERMRSAIAHAIDGEEQARVGIFLSGGLDSSMVGGILSEVSGKTAKAFTIGFDCQAYDERKYAEAVARHFGIEHHVYTVTPKDVVDVIPRIAEAYDEPFGNSSTVPVYYCARLAREHGVRCMLAGDGGDELFAGNAWYSKMKLYERYYNVPRPVRRYFIEPLVFGIPLGDRFFLTRKLRNYIARAKIPMPERGFNPEAQLVTDTQHIMAPEILDKIDLEQPVNIMREAFQRTRSPSFVHRMMHMDLQVVLADNDLRKVNRMCALAGVRVRYPFLDEGVVEFSARVPPSLQIRGLTQRYFYRKALDNYLPSMVLTKQKHGFGLPFGIWLKNSRPLQELAYDSLKSIKERGLVRSDYVDCVMDTQRNSENPAFAGPVWDLMILELWLQTHIE